MPQSSRAAKVGKPNRLHLPKAIGPRLSSAPPHPPRAASRSVGGRPRLARVPDPLPLDSATILRRMVAYLLILLLITAAAVIATRAWRKRRHHRGPRHRR